VCTDAFIGLAREESRNLGMPELPIAIIRHPLGGLKAEQVAQRSREALEQVALGLTRALR
jgi:hypothetical protein